MGTYWALGHIVDGRLCSILHMPNWIASLLHRKKQVYMVGTKIVAAIVKGNIETNPAFKLSCKK